MQSLRRDLATAGLVDDGAVRRFPEDVDLALADAFLEIQIAEHESGHFLHRNPSLWTGEAIFSVIALVTREFAPLSVRLPCGGADGGGDPGVSRRRAPRPSRIAGSLASPARNPRRVFRRGSPVRGPSSSMVDRGGGRRVGVAAARAERGLAAAAEAFTDFAAWLERDLAARQASAFLRASRSHLLSRGAHLVGGRRSKLCAGGRRQLDRAIAELDRCAGALAPGGWPRPGNLAERHPSAEDYCRAIEHLASLSRAGWTASVLTWPDFPIRYVASPAVREAAPHLYYLSYQSPAPFDALPELEYVVTPASRACLRPTDRRLRAANDSAIKLNHVVHHGAIGHHVQN